MASLASIYSGGGRKPVTTGGTAIQTSPTSFLESILPGIGGQKGQVSDIITNLLNGTPSPSTIRNASATFGAENGLGVGSGATNRFGYDLYNQQGQKNQQTGIQDLLSTIQGFSQPTLEAQGQVNQNEQYYSGLNQNQNQFNTSQANQQNQQLYALLAQLSGRG
jgi:hypothetical protein